MSGLNRFLLRENSPTNIILIKRENALGKSDLFYTGVSYDHCCFIIVNDVTVGIVYLSDISDKKKKSLYIEWIEILAPFRGKGILRQVFKGLAQYGQTDYISLESEENYVPKYINIGCKHIGTDDITGLEILEYSA